MDDGTSVVKCALCVSFFFVLTDSLASSFTLIDLPCVFDFLSISLVAAGADVGASGWG